MEKLVLVVVVQGYVLDYWVVIDDFVVGGCLGLWMVLQNVIILGIDDVVYCVKVDDVVLGISEGLYVGMWSVGLVVFGNEFGVIWEEYQVMLKVEIVICCEWVVGKLYVVGVYYVVDILVDLLEVIVDINVWLVKGEWF